VLWTAAVSAVRLKFRTNNETARKWLRDLALEDDPLALWTEIRNHGRLGRVARLNVSNEPFFDPNVMHAVIMVKPSRLGYGDTADLIVFDPQGDLWWGEGEPPPRGFSINKGRQVMPCLLLPSTLRELVARTRQMQAGVELTRQVGGALLPRLRAALERAGITESFTGQKLKAVATHGVGGDAATRVELTLTLPDITALGEALARLEPATNPGATRTGAVPCRCGNYDATDPADLDEHVAAMIHVHDGTDHG
jgi:hypothetical protein